MSITVELPDTLDTMLRDLTDALAVIACNEHADIADFRECLSTPMYHLYGMLRGIRQPPEQKSASNKKSSHLSNQH